MFTWQDKLESFFDSRANEVADKPTLSDLCYISGREPRLWSDPRMCEDLAESIVDQLAVSTVSKVLEVGCAAGFLAALIAPRIGIYEGVDLAAAPLQVARRLGLTNATFQQAHGATLPFANGTFDAVFCYDVFTNLPSIDSGSPLIEEMLRVVRQEGRVLVGSIPDGAVRDQFQLRVTELQRELDARYGPLQLRVPLSSGEPIPEPKARSNWFMQLQQALGFASAPVKIEMHPQAPPEIICYDFNRDDFVKVGHRLGAKVEIRDIHTMNPYHGFRFHAVFTKAL